MGRPSSALKVLVLTLVSLAFLSAAHSAQVGQAEIASSPVNSTGIIPANGAASPAMDGLASAKEGTVENIIAEYKRAIKLSPNNALLRHNLGKILLDNKRFEEAVIEYREAVRLNPYSWQPHYGLGLAYLDLNRVDEATSEIKEVVLLNPNHALSRLFLGERYYLQGMYEQSAQEYGAVLKLNQSDTGALFGLGTALLKLDRVDEAEAAYKKILLIEPSNEYAPIGLSRISERRNFQTAHMVSYIVFVVLLLAGVVLIRCLHRRWGKKARSSVLKISSVAPPEYVVVIAIVLLSLMLRLWGLGETHPLLGDEAAIGYDAYSVMKTGMDTHRMRLPLLFEGWGDYKLPLSIYATIPSIAVFGLSKFGLRLPVALLGVASVIMTYLLARRLFGKEAAALAALLASVSPWHLLLSTFSYEVGFYISLMLLGVYLLYLGLKDSRWLYVGAACLALCMYVTLKAEMISPLLFFGFMALFRKELSSRKQSVLASVVVFILVVSPMAYLFLTERDFMTRFRQTGIGMNGSSVTTIAMTVSSNYLSYVLSDYLYVDSCGNIPTTPFSRLYHFQIPLLLVGMYHLLRFERKSKERMFLIYWFLVSPLAASFTTFDSCQMVRWIEPVFVLQIVCAYGAVILLRDWPRKAVWGYVAWGFAAFAIASILLFIASFHSLRPWEASDAGLESAVEYSANVSGFDEVGLISGVGRLSLYKALFLSGYDPATYQAENSSRYRVCDVTAGSVFHFKCEYSLDKSRTSLFIFTAKPVGLDGFMPLQAIRVNGGEEPVAWIYWRGADGNGTARVKHTFQTLPPS